MCIFAFTRFDVRSEATNLVTNAAPAVFNLLADILSGLFVATTTRTRGARGAAAGARARAAVCRRETTRGGSELTVGLKTEDKIA